MPTAALWRVVAASLYFKAAFDAWLPQCLVTAAEALLLASAACAAMRFGAAAYASRLVAHTRYRGTVHAGPLELAARTAGPLAVSCLGAVVASHFALFGCSKRRSAAAQMAAQTVLEYSGGPEEGPLVFMAVVAAPVLAHHAAYVANTWWNLLKGPIKPG